MPKGRKEMRKMKFYNERAKKVYPGLTFVVSGFDIRDSRYLDPVKQIVMHTYDGESYYMPASFCRFVDANKIDLETLIDERVTIIELETLNGRRGLYVEGGR